MRDDGAGWEIRLQALDAGGGVHPGEEQGGVLGGEWRAVGKAAEEVDGGLGLEPVAILEGLVAVEVVLGVLHVEASDAERGHVGVDEGGAAEEAEKDVGGGVIALGDGELEQGAEGDVDVGVGVLMLERAPVFGWDAVCGEKADGLIEGEPALLDLVEDGEGEGELEDGLHGRMGGGVAVAVERCAGELAGEGDLTVGLCGDGLELLAERSLGEGGCGEKGEQESAVHA